MKTISRVLVGVSAASGFATAAPTPPPATRGSTPTEPEYRSLLRILEKADAQAIRTYLKEPIEYNGLRFDDASCRTRFENADVIREQDFDTFAACIAKLNLQLSARSHPHSGSLVMTYDPGFEIEVALGNNPQRGWFIRSIGYANRHDRSDSFPTVSPEALEALRVAGEREAPLDAVQHKTVEAAEPSEEAYAWVKVCLDVTGKVAATSPRAASSRSASEVYVANVRGWKFKPFKVAGRASPVCGVYRFGKLRYDWENMLPGNPLRLSADTLIVSLPELEPLRLSGTTRIVPDTMKLPAALTAYERRIPEDKRWLGGLFTLQIDETGHATSASTVVGTADFKFDAKIEQQLRTWTFEPYVVDGKKTSVSTTVEINWGSPQPTVMPAGQ